MFSKFKRVFSGFYIDRKGYKRFRNSGKLFHRHVARRMIGRSLEEGEVVHHIDGNKRNNRRSNLKVCTRAQHYWIHHNKRNKYKRKKRYYHSYDNW